MTHFQIYLVLDPRITYEELKFDYADDADLAEGLKRSKVALYKRFNDCYVIPTNLDSSAVSSSPLPSTISPTQPPLFNFTAHFQHQVQRPSLNELDEYLRLPPQDFHSCDPINGGIHNVIAFRAFIYLHEIF